MVIKTKCFKLAFMMTALLIITMSLVGCGNNNDPAQSTNSQERTQVNSQDIGGENQSEAGINNKDQSKIAAAKKTEATEIKMDANMQKKLNTFFSNFSEAYVEPFAKGNIDDANLIRFGVLHVILNNEKLIEHKGDDNYGYIKAVNVDGADLYFWGIKPKNHISIEEFIYKDGYYQIQMGSGEGYTFSQIDKLYDLGDGTLGAEISIYNASSGFSGDPHATMEQWKDSGEEIPALNKKMHAVIQKINNNGNERYILLEYK